MEPTPDPFYFQRLDHTFIRLQWLPSIHYCRSKLRTGFPSDHYLLVTEFSVKPAACPPKPKPPPKLKLKQISPLIQHNYNLAIRGDPTSSLSTLTTLYTDGSGTKGKCSKSSAAGWGWCSKDGDTWIESCGAVCTNPDHSAYLGAGVGSNNTGELTAIAEALIFAQIHPYSHIKIYTDSQWSINVIAGKWKPKAHKQLINTIRRLYLDRSHQVSLHWIKAHVGHEGNEKADQLAEQGKLSHTTLARTNESAHHLQQKLQPSPHRPHTQQAHTVDSFTDRIHQAAKASFDTLKIHPGKPWIREETLEALHKARVAEANGDEQAKNLRGKAKRMARKDRIHHTHTHTHTPCSPRIPRETTQECGKQSATKNAASRVEKLT